MKVALLKGNRFNPWHLQAYRLLHDRFSVTAFRAESEIQRYYLEQDDGTPLGLSYEAIHYDTEMGGLALRLWNRVLDRAGVRDPRILPFHVRLRDFDLIHTWELFPSWTEEALEARRKFGVPVAVMVWDNIPFNMERDGEMRARKRRALEEADLFLVHTERSRRTLMLEGVSADRIVQFAPGVDTDLFSPGPYHRADLGLAADEFVILFVGFLFARKGIDFLLMALKGLLRDDALAGRKIRLLMVGAALGRERVETLARRLGVTQACTFAGSVPYGQMPNVFRSSNAFVLPSIATEEWQEQFGMSLIEAMACGTPAVSTYSGAIPEIAGDGAALCQPNDFLALYETLKDLILRPERREALGRAGRARALSHFGLQANADALAAVYEQCGRHAGQTGNTPR
ncbi:MAG: glycosyltransferase [Candidatus Hydrogenedentes bacterium]|nr:glycosyltransferase [Candidatus Hydrogenedentota bacterium]